MLDIRRLENGLERLGEGSRPTTPPLASPVAIDAFPGPPRSGIFTTFSQITETENTRECQRGVVAGGPRFEPRLTESDGIFGGRRPTGLSLEGAALQVDGRRGLCREATNITGEAQHEILRRP